MILQFLIAVLGGLAIFLTQQKHDRLKPYACIFGLASQPMFIWSTYQNAQWGMLALALFYTWAWALGLYYNWMPPWLEKEPIESHQIGNVAPTNEPPVY
jgi:nicotinamide riboside transporter PnuC